MSRLFAAIPLIAFSYVLLVQPMADRIVPGLLGAQMVWPMLLAASLLLAMSCWKDLDLKQLGKPPIIALYGYLLFAGASILWAYSPPEALKRWVQAVMIVTTIILPITLRSPRGDRVDGLFWCYAAALVASAMFVLSTPPMLVWTGEELGHPGYFLHKQYLGMCASIALLLACYSLFVGRRRICALGVIALALWLILESKSKTSLGFLLLSPVLACALLFASGKAKLPVVWLVAAIPIGYIGLSQVISNLSSRIAFRIYGDATFTGRTFIWDFIETHTAVKPWFGWGFHSYWFVPNSPSQMAVGFVRDMPSSHSGYLDLRLETGYVGLMLFLGFVIATLYWFEHVRRKDSRRAGLLLSLFIYIMVMNLMETIWFISFDPLWILFLVISAETTRHGAAPDASTQLISAHRHPRSRTMMVPVNQHPYLPLRRG